MNELEKQLSYPFGDTLPALADSIQVAPGVRWIRMKLPFALDHINLWLLRDKIEGREGWTIVDCGVATDETKVAWEQVFETQMEGLPVLRVIVTHMHPDHIGLAHWLTEHWATAEDECRLWVSGTDFNAARLAITGSFPVGGPIAAAFFYSHGLTDEDSQDKVKARSNHYSSLVPSLPTRFRRLMDGLRVEIGG
jgi:glyoxylase-like metal-dependent hydrolase (beta-lactamase superfamily II)